MDLAQWLSIIAVPLVAAIFATIWVVWREGQKESEALAARISEGGKDTRDAAERTSRELHEFKLFVAQYYASTAYAREIEARMTQSQNRIEQKLDKIEALIMEKS